MSRWALLTEFFPPHRGGIEDTLGRFAGALGHDLTVLTPAVAGDREYDARQSYRIERRSLFSGQTWPHWGWLMGWLRNHPAELVIFGHYSMAVVAGWFVRRPYAILIHGHDLLSELSSPFRRWLAGRILRSAQWVGVNSQFMAKHVHRLGVPWMRIVFAHPLVDDQRIQPPVQTALTAPHLITVCRLVARKNLAAVVDLLPGLMKEFPGLHYDIIGEGPDHDRISQHVHQLGLEQSVTFHGNVDDQKKWQLLRQASIGIMLPVAQGSQVEGFGLFFLEASAAGLPVVGSRNGGVAQAIIDGTTGWLVDPSNLSEVSDRIRELLREPEVAHQFGLAGQDYVRREFATHLRLQRFTQLLEREQQSQPPLVSVVIPAYQSARTISQTLDDLLAQSWPRLEIIVVDDGSTDDLTTVMRPYAERLKFIQQSNQGAAAARNVGAAQARGEFLLCVDADCRLDRELMTTMVVALQTHPNIDFVYSNFQFGPKGFRLFEFDERKLKDRNYIHTTSLMRRLAFPGFDPTLKKFQDWDLWLTMVEHGRRGLWIPRQLFRVQQHAGGMSTWLPRFVYRLPLIGQGRGSATIAKYRQAEQSIRIKHHLG